MQIMNQWPGHPPSDEMPLQGSLQRLSTAGLRQGCLAL